MPADTPALEYLGKPDPSLPPGLDFPDAMSAGLWKRLHARVGAGWFRDRFLLLFAKGVDRYARCLDAWKPLTGGSAGKMVLGRNAYGALLVLTDPDSQVKQEVRVLDPFQLTFTPRPRHPLSSFEREVLDNTLPAFFSDRLYKIWRQRAGRALGDDEILAPKRPEDAGGTWSIDALEPEDIFAFYDRTAKEWAEHIEKAAKRPAAKAKKREVWV